jgi:thymidylate synthase
MSKDQAIVLAKEVGATTYTNRHYPDRPFMAFSPEQLDAFVAALSPAPDCRTCIHEYNRYEEWDCRSLEPCTNGDQYQFAPAVVLWRTV